MPQGDPEALSSYIRRAVSGKRIIFVFGYPKGKTDSRRAVIREVETMIAFIDVCRHYGRHITHITLFNLKARKILAQLSNLLYDAIIKPSS